MRFKMWLEQERPIVSFDFDGVLHSSLIPGTTHPESFWDSDSWKPRLDMHQKLREEAADNDVVVVSARDSGMEDAMWEFIQKHNLPVKAIYVTNDRPKWSTLQKIGAIRHYDDSPRVRDELAGKPIEFVFVR